MLYELARWLQQLESLFGLFNYQTFRAILAALTALFLSLWLGPAFGLVLVLPGLVPHFFTGGAAGVYCYATGGRVGCRAVDVRATQGFGVHPYAVPVVAVGDVDAGRGQRAAEPK